MLNGILERDRPRERGPGCRGEADRRPAGPRTRRREDHRRPAAAGRRPGAAAARGGPSPLAVRPLRAVPASAIGRGNVAEARKGIDGRPRGDRARPPPRRQRAAPAWLAIARHGAARAIAGAEGSSTRSTRSARLARGGRGRPPPTAQRRGARRRRRRSAIAADAPPGRSQAGARPSATRTGDPRGPIRGGRATAGSVEAALLPRRRSRAPPTLWPTFGAMPSRRRGCRRRRDGDRCRGGRDRPGDGVHRHARGRRRRRGARARLAEAERLLGARRGGRRGGRAEGRRRPGEPRRLAAGEAYSLAASGLRPLGQRGAAAAGSPTAPTSPGAVLGGIIGGVSGRRRAAAPAGAARLGRLDPAPGAASAGPGGGGRFGGGGAAGAAAQLRWRFRRLRRRRRAGGHSRGGRW